MADEKKKTEAQILADAIGEAIRQNRQPGPFEHAGFTAEQAAKLREPTPPLRHRKVACKSEDTGATFTAIVVESRTMTHGRIIGMENYVHPPGVQTYQSAGGLVPDGMQILRAGTAAPAEGIAIPKHDLTPYYMQWRWEMFWQRDLRRFSGAELKSHHAIDSTSFATPWLEGRVWSSGEAA